MKQTSLLVLVALVALVQNVDANTNGLRRRATLPSEAIPKLWDAYLAESARGDTLPEALAQEHRESIFEAGLEIAMFELEHNSSDDGNESRIVSLTYLTFLSDLVWIDLRSSGTNMITLEMRKRRLRDDVRAIARLYPLSAAPTNCAERAHLSVFLWKAATIDSQAVCETLSELQITSRDTANAVPFLVALSLLGDKAATEKLRGLKGLSVEIQDWHKRLQRRLCPSREFLPNHAEPVRKVPSQTLGQTYK